LIKQFPGKAAIKILSSMKLKTFFVMLALVMTGAASVNAQVIIGDDANNRDPHAGAILDLSPLGTKKLGLLLPSVTLSASATEFTLATGISADQKAAARGMIVYNSANVLSGAGLYVWTGTEWKAFFVTND
jgi:hypothetical protein